MLQKQNSAVFMSKLRLIILFLSIALCFYGYFYSETWAGNLYALPDGKTKASIEGSYFLEIFVGQFIFLIGFVALIINVSSLVLNHKK